MIEGRREEIGDVGRHAVVHDPEVGLLLGEMDLQQRVELEQDATKGQPLAERDRAGVELLGQAARSPRRAGAASACSRRIGAIEWRFWSIRSSSG